MKCSLCFFEFVDNYYEKILSIKIRSRITPVCLFFLLIFCWESKINAQKSHSFIANGQHINIDTFDTQVNHIMSETGVPALSLAVINDNQIVFYNSYGYKQLSKKDKVNKRTIFEAASLSKSFVVFVAYKLVDEGKLDLDKPMYQYLEYEQLKHDPRYKLITARMILSHSSGIENWRWDNNPDTLEIISNPGERLIYSGEGYDYLARVIELILNESYVEYVKEMVLKPLKLKRTFTSYKPNKKSPSNYAIGHNSFEEEIVKWKNTYTEPAAGVHIIAKDYAKLIVSIFNNKYLSSSRVKDILEPIVVFTPDNLFWYYGAGFELLCYENDTIVLHAGMNQGFRNFVCYSVMTKSGFVVLTNSDRGDLIISKLNEMLVGLNLEPRYESEPFEQYPSNANTLLKIYKEKNFEEMLLKLEDLKNKNDGKINVKTLNELGYLFMGKDIVLAKRLIEENIQLYPESGLAYYILGQIYMAQNDYGSAYKNFKKTQELNFNLLYIEPDLKKCKQELIREEEERIKRVTICSTYVSINDTIQAENYCAMNGIQTEVTNDSCGGQNIGWIDAGDWMDYNVHVDTAGTYFVAFRVSSPEGSQFQLQSGTTILANVEIQPTHEWQAWSTVIDKVSLPVGNQTLRLYASKEGFNINWLRFSKTEVTNK